MGTRKWANLFTELNESNYEKALDLWLEMKNRKGFASCAKKKENDVN